MWLQYLTFLTFLHSTRASRILLTPFPWRSHVMDLVAIGGAMVDRGHEVAMMLPENYTGIDDVTKREISVIEYVRRDPDFSDMKADNLLDMMVNITAVVDFRTNIEGFVEPCTNALSDQAMFSTLEKLKFDIGIVDTFPNSLCYLVLMYRLGIPYISRTGGHEPWLSRNPALPSFVPFILGEDFTDKMTFKERLINTWTLIDWSINTRVPTTDDKLVTTYAPEKPFVSIDYLCTRSLLWLIDSDFVIDYPRPMMPNEVYMGGQTARPAGPLPSDIRHFIENAKSGAVLVSFGSHDLSPESMRNKMMEAFRQMEDLHFVWSHKAEFPADVPSNVLLKKWFSQNDLLGHPNVKLFITHGGLNSQFECIYHGVPMITVPFFSDQPYNAKRAASKGVSITMKLHNFSTEELISNIREMTEKSQYKEKIDKLSGIFRSRPMQPTERAVYWVEHVLEFGADHLRSAALDMPWYQYLMLDIMALILIFTLIITYGVYFILKFLFFR